MTPATAKNPSGFASADPLRQGPAATNAAKRADPARSIVDHPGRRGDCCTCRERQLQQNPVFYSTKIIGLQNKDLESAAWWQTGCADRGCRRAPAILPATLCRPSVKGGCGRLRTAFNRARDAWLRSGASTAQAPRAPGKNPA